LGGASGTSGIEEKCLSWRSVKKRDHLEYLGVSGGIFICSDLAGRVFSGMILLHELVYIFLPT